MAAGALAMARHLVCDRLEAARDEALGDLRALAGVAKSR
jgi:hypothetical protein